jgi:hypothetical protein
LGDRAHSEYRLMFFAPMDEEWDQKTPDRHANVLMR